MFSILLSVPTSILWLHPCSMGSLCQPVEAPRYDSGPVSSAPTASRRDGISE